jgi:invasion protein IalB
MLAFVATCALVAAGGGPAAADPPGHRRESVPERFLDWQKACRDATCAISTRVAGAEGGEVLRLSLAHAAGHEIAITTPLPLLLPDGLLLAIGPTLQRQVPWRSCSAQGTCEAHLPLDAETLAALRRERGGTATFTLHESQPVRVAFSLMGFTGALRALDPPRLSPDP